MHHLPPVWIGGSSLRDSSGKSSTSQRWLLLKSVALLLALIVKRLNTSFALLVWRCLPRHDCLINSGYQYNNSEMHLTLVDSSWMRQALCFLGRSWPRHDLKRLLECYHSIQPSAQGTHGLFSNVCDASVSQRGLINPSGHLWSFYLVIDWCKCLSSVEFDAVDAAFSGLLPCNKSVAERGRCWVMPGEGQALPALLPELSLTRGSSPSLVWFSTIFKSEGNRTAFFIACQP